MTKTVNVGLSVMTSGSSKSSDILNFSLCVDGKSQLYCERSDFPIEKVSLNNVCAALYEKQNYNDRNVTKNENIREEDVIFTDVKDNDIVLRRVVETFLEDISDNGKNIVRFWVNSPIDWLHFSNLAFLTVNEVVELPPFILPTPMNVDSVLSYVRGPIKEGLDGLEVPEEVEYNSRFASQFISGFVTNVVYKVPNFDE